MCVSDIWKIKTEVTAAGLGLEMRSHWEETKEPTIEDEVHVP